MTQLFGKITFTLLIFTAFIMSYANMSIKFDMDLGWNLRFGKEVLEQKSIPLTDTYTWSHYGQLWINHEWGGDILEWLLYQNFGYNSLLLIMSAILSTAFLLVPKVFNTKISPPTVATSIVGLWSVQHITTMRLASISVLFVFALWYTLRNLDKQPLYWWWPLIFWVWSAIHGSWILGFIMIAIYWFSEVGKHIFKHWIGWLHEDPLWSKKTLSNSVIATVLSAILITVNPYGINLWYEVTSYFHFNFYKTVITEWVPSYTYPIFIRPLFFTILGAISLIIGWKKKWIRAADILLFILMFISATLYKRQALFIVFISVAIISQVLNEKMIQTKLENIWLWVGKFGQKFLKIYVLAAILLVILLSANKINYSPDVWHDVKLLEDNSSIPYQAVQFLNNETKNRPEQVRIFNEFTWGAYMNWAAPNTLVYLDGRGTATWLHIKNETKLQHYFYLLDNANSLKELEENNVEYILLKQPDYSLIPPPNFINKIIFQSKPAKNQQFTPAILKILDNNKEWTRIYSDNMAIIWKRTNNMSNI